MGGSGTGPLPVDHGDPTRGYGVALIDDDGAERDRSLSALAAASVSGPRSTSATPCTGTKKASSTIERSPWTAWVEAV
jgi:hypothetical protein